MFLQFAPGWLQPGDTWYGAAPDLRALLQRVTDEFARRVNPTLALQHTAAGALAYNIQKTAGDVTVLRAPHQVETRRGHDWVHYTLRSARALASYQLHLRTEPGAPSNFEARVSAVSTDGPHRQIIWTGAG